MTDLKKKIEVDLVYKIMQIFSNNGWPFQQPASTEDENLFENFCELFYFLNKDEQELILTLTEDFSRFTLEDYYRLFTQALQEVDKSLLSNNRYFYLIPLDSPTDIQKARVKSGGQAAYIARGILHNLIDTEWQKIIDVADVVKLAEIHSNRKNSLIIFIDDFIGTGNTACETLYEYCKNSVTDDDVIIVSAVTLRIGAEAIRDLGFELYSSVLLKKGIEESAKIDNKDEAYKIIDGIEQRLNVSSSYHRGFRGSEALVKMFRTPNNTFPLYWCNRMKNGNRWPAPFPR